MFMQLYQREKASDVQWKPATLARVCGPLIVIFSMTLNTGFAQDAFPSFEDLMRAKESAAESGSGETRSIPDRRPPDGATGTGFDRPHPFATPDASDDAPARPADPAPARPLPETPDREFRWNPDDRRDSSDTLRDRRVRSEAREEPTGGAQRTRQDSAFPWHEQQLSVADLNFAEMTTFQHGDAFLTSTEETAYLEMLAAIRRQRFALLKRTADEASRRTISAAASVDAQIPFTAKGAAEWQEAFYQFPHARRLAWANGHLRSQAGEETLGGLPDPFRSKDDTSTSEADIPYDLLRDVNQFPEDFVGRPIVLYGRFQPRAVVRLGDPDPGVTIFTERSTEGLTQQRDRAVELMRGTLSALNGAEQLAMIDTQELLTPQMGTLRPRQWPRGGDAVPVIVKGWVVKKWNHVPLIYCESVRQISPIPHFSLVRQTAVDRSRLRESEKWLYYETLTQLAITSAAKQREVAASVLGQRIDELMADAQQKAAGDASTLTEKLQAGKITEDQHRDQKVAMKRRLRQRVEKYKQCRREPADFETYVDVFQHPDFWQGHLVTLQGHVRHVVSYPGDETLFGGRLLHELWLFTEDSQHNPAVVVTPELPADFPVESDVIDSVRVTGCCFKRYVYTSQDADRIAPLLLCGRVEWHPTADQVRTLVADGNLDADSDRAVAAASTDRSAGEAALMLACFLIIMVLMVMWGRVQREERDRVRLRKRIDDVTDIPTALIPGYTHAQAGFADDTLPRHIDS